MALPSHSYYRGSSLPMDRLFQVGEFLMSPNRRFCAQLQPNGAFGVYWTALDAVIEPPPKEFQPNGEPLWTTGQSGAVQDYFLCMQTDGNLVIYEGTNFQNRGAVLWENDRHGSGAYALNLQDNGALVVTREGIAGWNSGTDVRDDGFLTGLLSLAQDENGGNLILSSHPPTGANGLQAVVQNPGLSVTALAERAHNQYAPTPDQTWRRLDWYQDGASIGCVLINPLAQAALAWDGAGTTILHRTVNPMSTWTLGGPEDPVRKTYAIRPFTKETLNLNVKGDAPYGSGTEVILWRWNKGGADNLIWMFWPRISPTPAPPTPS